MIVKILLVEDKEEHRQSARETLGGHDLSIFESFDEVRAFFDKCTFIPGLETGPSVVFDFDVVLTDMLMPTDQKRRRNADEASHVERQEPFGFIIALKAALLGAKYVAMVTDTNHHVQGMSSALDCIEQHNHGGEYDDKPNFSINGAKVLFVHAPLIKDVVGKKNCEWCHGTGVCRTCKGTGQRDDEYVRGLCNVCQEDVGKCRNCKGKKEVDIAAYTRKDWGRVVARLIKE
jgi:CheY-like chemotaxis protein